MKMKVVSAIAILCIGLGAYGCGPAMGSPSGTVKRFYEYINTEQLDKAVSLFSRSVTDTVDKEKIKAAIAVSMQMFKMSGGIRSIEIVKEEIKEGKAQVTVTVKLGNGEENTETIDLVREDGAWKVAASK